MLAGKTAAEWECSRETADAITARKHQKKLPTVRPASRLVS